MNEALILILITFSPFIEIRGSIPIGIATFKMHPLFVFVLCIISNIIIGFIVFVLIDKIISLINKSKRMSRIYKRYIERNQKRIRHVVDKYGVLGLALFIAIPLPGSGVYTGAILSYALGLKFKRFAIASIIGVIIAGIIVTILTLSGVFIVHNI